MENYLGKRVKLIMKVNGEELFYTALITKVTDKHITFEDRYGDSYTYKIKYIEEIAPL